MPSLMACLTPWVQPAAMAPEISFGVALARSAMARRVLRRAVSLKLEVPAAWAASWVISWMPSVWRSRHWPCCFRRKPADWLQYLQVPISNGNYILDFSKKNCTMYLYHLGVHKGYGDNDKHHHQRL